MRTPKQGWTRVCQKKKAIVPENEKAKTPPAEQKKTTKHIIIPQISMLLLESSLSR